VDTIQALSINIEFIDMKQRFFIRQVRQPDELRQMFALRYCVFRDSGETIGFAPQNDYTLCMDPHDLKSAHFGLFCEEGGSSRMIGGMRICFADGHVQNGEIVQLSQGCPELEHVITQQTRQLPFLEYSHLSPEVQAWFSNFSQSSLVEPGKFFIERAYRRSGLGLFMLRCMAAIAYFHQGVEYAIVAASRTIAPIYLKFGFEQITGTDTVRTHGTDYSLLWLNLNNLSKAHKLALAQKARVYGQTHQIFYEADTIQLTPNHLKKTG
jgi:hypothetical protein